MISLRPIGTFALSHQLLNNGMVVPVTGFAIGSNDLADPVVASPVCELGPKSSEELYWGKFYGNYIIFIYLIFFYMNPNLFFYNLFL